MTFSVMIRASARRDIDRAHDWYAEHAPEHVPRFLDQRATVIERIRSSLRAFHPLQQDARRATLRVFPYGVWYRVHEELQVIEVLALVHERQDPSQLSAALENWTVSAFEKWTLDDWRVITLEDWALIRRLAAEGVSKSQIAARL